MPNLPKFTRRNILFVLSLLATIDGIWGTYRLYGCVAQGDIPSGFVTNIQQIGFFWALFAGFLLTFTAAIAYAPVFESINSHLMERGPQITIGVGSLMLFVLGLLSLIFTTNIDFVNACLQTAGWIFVVWGVLGVGMLMTLYPSIAGRLTLASMSLLLTLGFMEAGLRLYYRLDPSYNFQIVKPHPVLGWTLIPNSEFVWEGQPAQPACMDFSVEVFANSMGFFDTEHEPAKPDDTIRIEMLGDSFIQAMQIPFEARASQVLESRLNADLTPQITPSRQFEVLNFGVNSFSTGQIYLAYREFGTQFEPDYVMVLLSEIIMDRSPEGFIAASLLDPESGEKVNLRPSFRMEGDGEIYHFFPAEYTRAMQLYSTRVDENEQAIQYPVYLDRPFVTTSDSVLTNPYQFVREQSQLAHFFSLRANAIVSGFGGTSSQVHPDDTARSQDYLAVQQFILDDFSAMVEEDGARLVFLDDTLSPGMGQWLQSYADAGGHGYISIREPVERLANSGQDVTFLCDRHYNANVNAAIADTIYQWVADDLLTPIRIYGDDHVSVFDQRNGEFHVYRIEADQGIFVLSFRMDDLADEIVILDGDADWSVQATPTDDSIEFQVLDPSGDPFDESFGLGGQEN